jgi:hypothetical protein
MGYTDTNLAPDLKAFVDSVTEEAAHAFRVLRETNTLTANGTVGFVVRVPNQEVLVSVNDPGPWYRGAELKPAIYGFDGTTYAGREGGGGRYLKLFQQHPHFNIISHVHTPYVAAWAQTHRTLPISYVPYQRHQLVREIPVYIDRRQPEIDFILDQLKLNPHHTAIVEANGGGTIWGKGGIRELTDSIILFEELAQVQLLAESVGGSRTFGAGALRQNWRMTGLYDQAKELGIVPVTDL